MTFLSRTSLAAGLIGTLVTTALALPAPVAAATGIAFESVTKFAIAQDASEPAPAPGTFGADFAAATSTNAGGDMPKMPFGLGRMMAKANAAIGAIKNGTAEKHYVGVTKERVDELAAKTGEITDCTARTITHLDFDKKTYSVESMDRPQTATPASGGGHRSAPGPAPTDDGTKIAIAVTTKALGSMMIEGVPTTGYDMNIKMTATKPTGETSTSNMNMLAYYSAYAEPHFGCASRFALPMTSAPPGGGAGMQSFAMAMRAMTASKSDSRFTVTNSGPPIPSGKLAMWQDMKMIASGTDRSTGQSGQGGFSVIMERGALQMPLADSDPAFDVPAGFTKVSG